MRTTDFVRYLEAKRKIDDRSLDRHTADVFERELAALAGPLDVLELGAGIGSTVERLVPLRALAGARYTALDADDACLAAMRRRLAGRELPFTLELEKTDLDAFLDRSKGRRSWHLVVAHAFLDLVSLERTVPRLVALLRPGGLVYCTLTFDGVTAFAPAVDPELDARIEAAYHGTMDERRSGGQPSGDSRSGRHLLLELRRAGATLLAAGGSDWVLFAGADGFDADERFFLETLVDTVAATVAPAIEAAELRRWHVRRRAQIEDGSLVLVVHQLDVLARR